MRRKIVFIASPLRGDYFNNLQKARYYCRFAYERGCLPIAPHTMFTQFLDDEDKHEREAGIAMGVQLLPICDEIWVFGKATEGMALEISIAKSFKLPIRRFNKQCEEHGT